MHWTDFANKKKKTFKPPSSQSFQIAKRMYILGDFFNKKMKVNGKYLEFYSNVLKEKVLLPKASVDSIAKEIKKGELVWEVQS